MAGLFRDSAAADAALGDLKLRGFQTARLEPYASAREEARVGAFPPAGAQPDPEVAADDGKQPFENWAADSTGWMLLNVFEINEAARDEWAAGGGALVVVQAGAKEAIVRSILERNGAAAVREVPPAG